MAVGPVGLSHRSRELSRCFARLVEAEINREVVLVVASSYAELLGLVERGETSIAWLPPALFVRGARIAPLRLVACADRAQRLQGALFVRRDAPWTTLEEVSAADSAVGWVDPLSCSGYLYPRLTLEERGFGSFRIEHHLGSHRAVAQAVGAGKVQVGATFINAVTGELGCGKAHEERVRLLAKTVAIPPDVICCLPSLSEDEQEAVEALLLGLGGRPEGGGILRELFQVDSFRRAGCAEFEDLERAIASIEASDSTG